MKIEIGLWTVVKCLLQFQKRCTSPALSIITGYPLPGLVVLSFLLLKNMLDGQSIGKQERESIYKKTPILSPAIKELHESSSGH
jgi:hypothetical protein